MPLLVVAALDLWTCWTWTLLDLLDLAELRALCQHVAGPRLDADVLHPAVCDQPV